eukprot:1108612-Amphidinium_carterae.1
MEDEDVNNFGEELLPDAVTGPQLLPPPVTPHSSSDASAFSSQQETTVRPSERLVMSNEYLTMIRERFQRGYTLEEIGQRWAASGSASSVSPVTLEMTQNIVTTSPQAVDVPVPDDDMNDVPFEGESQGFEDEPD